MSDTLNNFTQWFATLSRDEQLEIIGYIQRLNIQRFGIFAGPAPEQNRGYYAGPAPSGQYSRCPTCGKPN
jgi:hypothetical protein